MLRDIVNMGKECGLSSKGSCKSFPIRSRAKNKKPTSADPNGVIHPSVSTIEKGRMMQIPSLSQRGRVENWSEKGVFLILSKAPCALAKSDKILSI